MSQPSAYSQSGVNYEQIDPFKLYCMELGMNTEHEARGKLFETLSKTRGESAFGFRFSYAQDLEIYHVEETLGTKNLVADAMQTITGKKHFHSNIAKDAVAMIVNDLITQGALPFSIAMHLAVGDSAWFDDSERAKFVAEGWHDACVESAAVWAGGETPTLKGIVFPETYLLSGSAVGYKKKNYPSLSGENIKPGDGIVIFPSSGPHANGLSLCRSIVNELPMGYLTKIPDGRTYGEALLVPTMLYVKLMETLIHTGTKINYAVNITGHGWKKFMRPKQPFMYTINKLPDENSLFAFICENAKRVSPSGEYTLTDAYENFNMGAGFAVYAPLSEIEKILQISHMLGIKSFHAGTITASDKPKVVIEPLGIVYESLFYH